MVNQKLFLWEFLISKIRFDPRAVTVPIYENIRVQLRCSNFLWTEINTDECPLEGIAPDFRPENGEFIVKIGKSSLFAYNPNDLVLELENNPLLVDIIISRKWAANIMMRWPQQFIDFIRSVEAGNAPSPSSFTHTCTLDLADTAKTKIADVGLSIKLAYVGENVQTCFSIKNKEVQFMNPVTNTQFKYERVEFDQMPNLLLKNESKISWMGLYEGKMAADAVSIAPQFMEDGARQMQKKVSKAYSHMSGRFDTVSIRFRPEENKFMDFLQLVADDVAKAGSGHSLATGKGKHMQFADQIAVYSQEKEEEETTELTSEKVMRSVCNNPCCPAAQKFKEYGLGPLATGPGLGTMYKKVEPTKTYRLSNTYGVFTNYGPYGVFAKSEYPHFPPKEDPTEVCPLDFPCMPDEEEPEIDCACEEKLEKPKDKTTCDCSVKDRQRGGQGKNKKRNCCPCKNNQLSDKDSPLRLRGGGLMNIESRVSSFERAYKYTEYEFNQFSYFSKSRLRGGGKCDDEKPGQMKSAMEECKSVMDQFDQILMAYKKALGPCGEATCPFSQNMVEKNCKKICFPPPRDPCPCAPADSCQELPCTMEACPYKEKAKKNFPAGCGSMKCPYAMYKMGLMDADAEMELAFLPPPIQGKCGDPKCDYPPQNIKLPPIHWDCPDPLPQGNCKNPNCPHQPKDLKQLTVAVPKPPCGSNACPYALPPPCDLPSCPFRQKPCPFQSHRKEGDPNPKCDDMDSGDSDVDECCNPNCPFKNKKGKTEKSGGCYNPKCPGGKKETPKNKKSPSCGCKQESDSDESFCDSPECPLNRRKPNDDSCNNPECPSKVIKRHQKNDDEGACENSDCPYKDGQGNRDDENTCDNPECPFKSKGGNKNVDCSNPSCPYKGSAGVADEDNASICSSPECPFSKRRKAKTREPEGVCENPDCPFRFKKAAQEESGGDGNQNLCSNPNCPEKNKPKGPDYCDNPMCPFSKEYQTSVCVDPFCPYAQPLPSCGIPNCPYEKKPIMYCPSPICPSKFPQEARLTGGGATPQQTQRRASGDAEDRKSVTENKKKKKEMDAAGDVGKQKENVVNTATETKDRKRKSPYVYSIGDQWPGVKIGHRECIPARFRIPQKMGWMWKIQQPYFGCKMRRGWRPGCIEKIVAGMIRLHRESKGLGLLMLPDFGKGGKKRRGPGTESSDDVHVKPKPTLHITKKDGAYMITMNPLKDPNTLAENEDPYMECTPMQFKITKNKLKGAGDDDACACDGPGEEDSDDSELDIEFTPPAGIIHPDRFKKKKNVIHTESQYNPADFAEKKPKKGDKKGDKKGEKKGGKGGKDKGKSKKDKKKNLASYC